MQTDEVDDQSLGIHDVVVDFVRRDQGEFRLFFERKKISVLYEIRTATNNLQQLSNLWAAHVSRVMASSSEPHRSASVWNSRETPW